MMQYPRHVVFENWQCPGDVLLISAAIKALHQSHPGIFLTDVHGAHAHSPAVHEDGELKGQLKTKPGNNLFANNPYITTLNPHTSQIVRVDYGSALNRNVRQYSFIHGIVEEFERKLGVKIDLTEHRGDIYLSEEEKQPWPGLPEKYALIDAGHKADYTAKMWSHYRYQQVVNATKDEIQWVQIGAATDTHRPLENVINLVGQTDLRQLIRVFYRSSLVLTPVSLPMHLAAAVPTPADGPREMPLSIEQRQERWYHQRQEQLGKGPGPEPLPGGSRLGRPCVVIMGLREGRAWELYNGHAALGTTGKLKCGVDIASGGCWRSKTIQIDQDDSLCFKPLADEEGFAVPECLHRVSSENVIKAVRSFL